MSEITRVRAREILDSRGYPTVEVAVAASSGASAVAAVPSGASTGTREAVELRDADPARYSGRGVRRAVEAVNGDLARLLVGHDVGDLAGLDAQMCSLDGTQNKSRLGANAILGCSLACARLAAREADVPLYRYLAGGGDVAMPVPFCNILNGGAHADNRVDMQEFMIAPIGMPTFAEAMRAASETYQALKAELRRRGLATGIGDEGGFAPDLAHNRDAIELVIRAIETAGFRPGVDVAIGLDPAASEFFVDGVYELRGEGSRFSSDEMVQFWADIVRSYPVITLEDAMAENDWSGWAALTEQLGDRVELVGDDIFVTNAEILRDGIDRGIANSILIKPNQIGTVTETLTTMHVARSAGYACFVSHRSGETWDDFIADLAVAGRTGRIKAGAPVRGERVAKYNRLLQIEAEAEGVRYLGGEFTASVP
jgi:enolase